MQNKISRFLTKTLPSTILSISSRYVTFQLNNRKVKKDDRRKGFDTGKLYDYLYCLYLLYLSFLILRMGVAALVIHRIIITFNFSSSTQYFASVDPLIGHMLKVGLLNRHLGLVCVPFTMLLLFDHWFYFGGSNSGGGGDNTTYRLLYDLTVLNKRNFFQLNRQQLGGWSELAVLKLQEWLFSKKSQQTTKLKVTSSPLACLPNLPPAIRLRAALFSLTADLLIALLFAYFAIALTLFLPYSFLQTSYLQSLMLRLYLLAEMSIMSAATLYKVLISLLLGHLFALLVMVLRRQQATATAQLKHRIELVKRGNGKNSEEKTCRLHNLTRIYLGSAYLPLHSKVVMHCQRANDQLFSRSLFYFISATLVMNINQVTRLVFETMKPEMKLQALMGCVYQLAAIAVALWPMVATERVMVEAGLQHFRSQVYLPTGSGNSVALSFKLAATTTTDSRKPYAFAFTLGPLGPVTAKFIMELLTSYSAYLLFSFSIVINETQKEQAAVLKANYGSSAEKSVEKIKAI